MAAVVEVENAEGNNGGRSGTTVGLILVVINLQSYCIQVSHRVVVSVVIEIRDRPPIVCHLLGRRDGFIE
jgi:hypothetical protein